MKFSTVQIRPSGHKRDRWEVSFSDLPFDRVDEKQGPHSLGFYHYPRKMGKEKAFEAMKAHIVKKHEEEIAALTKSLAQLMALKMPAESINKARRGPVGTLG
jgi:hypothetical protein